MTPLRSLLGTSALVGALVGTLACDSTTTLAPRDDLPAGAAVVTLAFTGRPADTLRIVVTDMAAIAAARAYVATKSGPALPIGTIVHGAGIDARFPFHFEPGTVRFVDFAIELCDGAPMHTAGAVDEFMRGATGLAAPTSATWCPWSAYPIRVQ